MNERLRRRRLAIVKRRQREREWRRRLLDWRVRPARMIREHLSVDLDDWREKALNAYAPGAISYVDPEDWPRLTSFWGQTRS